MDIIIYYSILISMRKNDEQLKSSIMSIIIPAFSAVINEANEERKLKMNKVNHLIEF